MSKILGVGIATLDIINIVDHYPHEDEELRTLGQRILRGGNATNTLITLSQLGDHCAWAGTISDEPNAKIITEELNQFRIDQSAVKIIHDARLPTSYITLNQANGSRTIVHHRELDEYSFSDFAQINLAKYEWIHFEGRNIEQVAMMLKHVRALFPEKKISLEIEKPRDDIETLFSYADVLLFSRVYALSCGIDNGEDFLRQLNSNNKQLFCAWGSKGAYGRENDTSCFSPAYSPVQIIDTIGAGDVFNAAIIHSLAQGSTLADSLSFAVKLAGEHCGRSGLLFSS